MSKCQGCRANMNPVERMMGPMCGACVRMAHRVAIGEMSREAMRQAQLKRMGRESR